MRHYLPVVLLLISASPHAASAQAVPCVLTATDLDPALQFPDMLRDPALRYMGLAAAVDFDMVEFTVPDSLSGEGMTSGIVSHTLYRDRRIVCDMTVEFMFLRTPDRGIESQVWGPVQLTSKLDILPDVPADGFHSFHTIAPDRAWSFKFPSARAAQATFQVYSSSTVVAIVVTDRSAADTAEERVAGADVHFRH